MLGDLISLQGGAFRCTACKLCWWVGADASRAGAVCPHVALDSCGCGAGIVAARTPKKVLQMAGIEDCYTASRGHTRTLGNFVKATFAALENTYGFLTPELWKETKFKPSPLQEFTDLLAKPYVAEKRAAAPAY